MLKSFRVSNYRCIQDLKVEFDSLNLLMGENGSGKSTLFDALAAVREFIVMRKSIEETFPVYTLPRWNKLAEEVVQQNFYLEFDSPWGTLKYDLVVGQDLNYVQARVEAECLTLDDTPLFEFREGRAQAYYNYLEPAHAYPAEDSRSVLAGVPSVAEYEQIAWFKDRIARTLCLRVDAPQITARTEKDAGFPLRNFSNFASWYRRALVTDSSGGLNFLTSIREVLPGLQGLDLRELGQGVMVLEAVLRKPNSIGGLSPLRDNKYRVAFNELSDGQRALVALYAILHFLVRDDATVWIDEPDNFVALPELQPWLNAVIDAVDANNSQVLIASHHPEMYNLLAPEHGIVLERTEAGPTVARRYNADPESPLTPAERAARGYE